MTFDTLNLGAPLLRAVAACGFTTPTPIQRQAIPAVLSGRDVFAGAQTGTGKTAAFALPLLQRLSDGPTGRIRALVLAPTRELAAQVEESFREYARFLPLRSLAVFGGVAIGPQMKRIGKGVEVLVATPGRLLDLADRGAVDLGRVEAVVLDEADRMLDMGFIHDLRRILALLPPKRQTLLFSATYSDEIRRLSAKFLHEPEQVEVARKNTAAESVEQRVYPVDRERKRELLSFLIGSQNWRQVLVFTRTKHGANRLAQQLEKDGLSSAAIHGNKSQGARTRALADFKQGTVRVLVATDIAARGLDIDKLPHVVNYDLPQVPEDYVHRIGRTGRAGSDGEAISLVEHDEMDLLARIERLLNRRIPSQAEPGFEPSRRAAPRPQHPRGQPAPASRAKRSAPAARRRRSRSIA